MGHTSRRRNRYWSSRRNGPLGYKRVTCVIPQERLLCYERSSSSFVVHTDSHCNRFGCIGSGTFDEGQRNSLQTLRESGPMNEAARRELVTGTGSNQVDARSDVQPTLLGVVWLPMSFTGFLWAKQRAEPYREKIDG